MLLCRGTARFYLAVEGHSRTYFWLFRMILPSLGGFLHWGAHELHLGRFQHLIWLDLGTERAYLYKLLGHSGLLVASSTGLPFLAVRNDLLLVAQDVAHEVPVLRLLTVVTVVQELLSLSADYWLPVLDHYLLILWALWRFQVNVFQDLLLGRYWLISLRFILMRKNLIERRFAQLFTNFVHLSYVWAKF